jgi:hypothetical protein
MRAENRGEHLLISAALTDGVEADQGGDHGDHGPYRREREPRSKLHSTSLVFNR